jgi:Straboviridae DNA replication helicase
MASRPTIALQENLLALLIHNDEHGRTVANMVQPEMFEGDYRTLSERCITYWMQHKEAPKTHMPDLVSDIIEDKKNKRAATYKRLLLELRDLSSEVNTKYVVDQCRNFTRMQRVNSMIMQSAEKLASKQEFALEEIQQMWHDLLRTRDTTFDAGVRLSDYYGMIERLKMQSDEFRMGIEQLDNKHITPMRGGVMIMLGGAGRGKSWFLTHVGKQALEQRKKVVHITLELSQDQVQQRYFQSMLSVPKREDERDEVELTILEKDKRGRLEDMFLEKHTPEFSLTSPEIDMELRQRIDETTRGVRLHNLIIKSFPMRSVDMKGIASYLDDLEAAEKFIPDMIILDYIGILKTNVRDHRLNLGRNFEDFRGLCTERNIAGVTAHQISKEGVKSGKTSQTHIAEDWSMVGTADVMLTYSCTDLEFAYGLGRLYVAKSRSEKDRFGLLMTQNYTIGQFVIESMYLPHTYFDLRDQFAQPTDVEGRDVEADDDEEDE